MSDLQYDGSLGGFLELVEKACRSGETPRGVRPTGPHRVLQAEGPERSPFFEEFRELSLFAAEGIIHAWLSEEPVEGEILRYAQGVYAAARNAPGPGCRAGPALGQETPWEARLSLEASREAAERTARDRGNPVTLRVLEAAWRVTREIDRLRGFLRFNPDRQGVWIARCGPDHLVLPVLGPHFTRRFGDSPWGIIDERRSLCLFHLTGEPLWLGPLDECPQGTSPEADPWESLWGQYHRAINNESRRNPKLQRQFMPSRYWKYLPEMR